MRGEQSILDWKMMNSGGLHMRRNLSGVQENQSPDLTSATVDATVCAGDEPGRKYVR
jgi:hypothetical protein